MEDRERFQPWRKWYRQKAWTKILSPACLSRDLQCKVQITPLCAQHGGDIAVIADHIRDHKGDARLFFDLNNLQGVCKACHDKKTGLTSHGQGADPNAPVQTGQPGKQFVASTNPASLDRALAEDDDLKNVP